MFILRKFWLRYLNALGIEYSADETQWCKRYRFFVPARCVDGKLHMRVQRRKTASGLEYRLDPENYQDFWDRTFGDDHL